MNSTTKNQVNLNPPNLPEGLTIRKMDLKTDLDQMIALIDISFEEGLEEKGGSIREMMKEAVKMLPLVKIFSPFSKRFKHAIDGFVVLNQEEKIIASISVSFLEDSWEIGNVAVHPDYRKQGIARILIEIAQKHAIKFGAKIFTLDVLEGNTPAENLYLSEGFVIFDKNQQFLLKPDNTPDNLTESLPADFFINKMIRKKKVNIQRFELQKRIKSKESQEFLPIEKKKFMRSIFMRAFMELMKKLTKTRVDEWAIYHSNDPTTMLATMTLVYAKNEKLQNQMSLYIDPQFSDTLSKPLISFLLQELQTNKKFDVNTFASMNAINDILTEAYLGYNYIIHEKMNVMGKKVEN